MELTELQGTHIWSGIEVGQVDDEDDYDAGLCFKFTLDGITYLAIEDEGDGYRSFMRELQVSSEPCNTPLPDILVRCEYEDENERDILKIYEVASGNLILVLGTVDIDDWYPYCIMDYHPERLSINQKEVSTK